MSARLEELARAKQLLLMRSALGRLRLRRDSLVLRSSLRGGGIGLATRLVLGYARRFLPARYVRPRTDGTKSNA